MRGQFISSIRSADALNILFLAFLLSLTLLFSLRLDHTPQLMAAYAGLIAAQIALLRMRHTGPLLHFTYDIVFPTVSILSVFESLEYLVHRINPRDVDPLLIRLDYLLFGGYPTVMLETIMQPLLTDILQVAYSTYYFLPVALGIALKMRKDDSAFDRSLFLIMLCFYLSYVGYLLMPALGPRYTIHHLHHGDLMGIVLTQPIQDLLNRLEGIKRDAFPSGHTAIALTVLYLAHRFERRLFWLFLPAVAGLVFSTVYCRYHYVVDVIAGVLLAIVTVLIGERIYERRTQRSDPRR